MLGTAEAGQHENIAARLRLAAAMLGHRAGRPVTRPVNFGNRQISAAEFEKMVSEALKRYGGSTPAMVQSRRATPAAPAATPVSVVIPRRFMPMAT